MNLEKIEEKIKGNGIIQDGNFGIIGNGSAFLQFNNLSAPKGENTGWKFHISVSPEHRDKAFDIIIEEAKKYGINVFKVTNTEVTKEFHDPNDPQRGKMFTIYEHGEKGFKDFLQQVEKKLNAAGIQPSHSVNGDRAVGGSKYMYYRNDGNFKGGSYISAEESDRLPPEKKYNPLGVKDPYENFDVSTSKTANVSANISAHGFSRSELAEASVRADLANGLGKDNIINLRQIEGGFEIFVPSHISRSGLTDLGIRTSDITRSATNNPKIDSIIIPNNSLPQSIQKDIKFFELLDNSGISKSASDAYRIGENGKTTGYILEIPRDWSRSNLEKIGINPNYVQRIEGSTNATNKIIISADVADIALSKFPQGFSANVDTPKVPVASKLLKAARAIPVVGGIFAAFSANAKADEMQRDGVPIDQQAAINANNAVVVGASFASFTGGIAAEEAAKKALVNTNMEKYAVQTTIGAIEELNNVNPERKKLLKDVAEYVEKNGIPPEGHKFHAIAKAMENAKENRFDADDPRTDLTKHQAAQRELNKAADTLMAQDKLEKLAKEANCQKLECTDVKKPEVDKTPTQTSSAKNNTQETARRA